MLNGPSGEEKRNKIRCYRLHGEANSAPLETFLEEWRKLQTILQDYSLDNIFNANEAELFFSNKCYWHSKLKPLVIGSSKNLDVFIESIEILFHDVLIMLIQRPGCEVIFLSAFLSPSTTAHGWRLAHVSFKSFKAIYKQHYIRHIIETNVNFKVKAEPIVNCWRKTGISPLMKMTMIVSTIQQALIAQEIASKALISFIIQMRRNKSILEMIPTEQSTTDAEIIQLILEEGNEKKLN
ncbi:hypothetical protein C1646_768096 [Rhizophagus diaphanus]|nr:hypothetical protein C1646_768096 [Rhizophagus diaphanus] [Rhizophagus sp. MUCL 43196]